MKKTKKSFILLSTLLLVVLFAFLSIRIFEAKNITSINIQNQYNYIQAKNHLVFLENYIKSLESLDLTDKINIVNDNFNIYALIKKTKGDFEAELIVEALDSKIRVYKRVKI